MLVRASVSVVRLQNNARERIPGPATHMSHRYYLNAGTFAKEWDLPSLVKRPKGERFALLIDSNRLPKGLAHESKEGRSKAELGALAAYLIPKLAYGQWHRRISSPKRFCNALFHPGRPRLVKRKRIIRLRHPLTLRTPYICVLLCTPFSSHVKSVPV